MGRMEPQENGKKKEGVSRDYERGGGETEQRKRGQSGEKREREIIS